jgi:hypothetical protein
MSNLHRMAAVLLAAAMVGEVRAQLVTSLPPPPPRSGTTAAIGFRSGEHRGSSVRVSVVFSSSFTTGYYAPYGYFPPYGNSVTVISLLPPPPPPAVVVVGPPTPQELDLLRDLNLAPRPPVDQPAEPPPPGIRRIGPNNRGAILAQPPMPPPPAPAPPPRAGAVAVPLPNPEHREENPKDEHARLVRLGKEAFAAQQYGRAAERFRRALIADDQATAHFLLAQAEFTLGKYFEAVDAIHAGLKLDPTWPSSSFRPQDLYAPGGDDFAEQMQRLQNALARHPDDPVLLFLYAYQLWFDGRRNEALPLFQRAAAVSPDKAAMERFLQAKP